MYDWDFVEEFVNKVANWGVSVAEVGARDESLHKALGAKKDSAELVYSVGTLSFASDPVKEIMDMAEKAKKYVVTVVPNADCAPYAEAKKNTKAPWRDEKAFTLDELVKLHEEAGLKVVEKGYMARNWAAKFGPNRTRKKETNHYLTYVKSKKIARTTTTTSTSEEKGKKQERQPRK